MTVCVLGMTVCVLGKNSTAKLLQLMLFLRSSPG